MKRWMVERSHGWSQSLALGIAAACTLAASSASAADDPDDDPWANAAAGTSTSEDVTSAPPPAPRPVDRPAPPRHKGTGMIAGAAVAGGVGLALNAGRIAWHLSTCRDTTFDDLHYSCLVSAWGDVFLSVPSWFANMGSIGLAAGGGVMRGRYEAAIGRKRDSRKMIIAGATMVGVGGAMYIVSRLARFGAVGCIGRDLGCYRGMYVGTTVGIQVGLSTAAAGAGILAFGDQYRRRSNRYQLSVAPQMGRGYAGLSVSGRF